MRLIDADAIKLPKGFFEKVDNVPKFYEWLDDQPTIEAEPVKHGHWSHDYDDESITGTCSICGWQSMLMETDVADMPYCPNCGAKMDMPTIKAEPVKHGRWEKIGHIENTWLVSKCSECGYQTIDAGNYCTNCGAKMDGIEE